MLRLLYACADKQLEGAFSSFLGTFLQLPTRAYNICNICSCADSGTIPPLSMPDISVSVTDQGVA